MAQDEKQDTAKDAALDTVQKRLVGFETTLSKLERIGRITANNRR